MINNGRLNQHSVAQVVLCTASIVLSMTGSRAQQPTLRPYAKVGNIHLSEVKWTSGFWKQRHDTCREKMIPSMWEIMKGTQFKPFLEHFRIAAGLSEGGYHGPKWNDGDFYKWMEAVVATLAVDPDPVWDKRLDEIIDVIGKAQRTDGYIHTPVLIGARNGDPSSTPFSDRFAFEMYNMGHLMSTACLHHRVTGKDNFLAIAKKTATFLDTAFQDPTAEHARHAVCPSHYMGILDLYRTTQDPKHLELAKRFMKMRDLVTDGGDDNQDRVPLAQQSEAAGHAVRANYLFAGAADLFAETGDPALWAPLEKLWESVVLKKMYITGGCGALYDGASPDGSKNQGVITRVHQAYGRNYQLPNTTAHNETCANIGNVLWNWRMFLVTGEARYIDVVELALYNSVLSGVGLNGTDYFYTNPLRQFDTSPLSLRWSRTRQPWISCFCCPPNVVRTVAEVGGYAYGKSEDAIWVNLYGSNTFTTQLGAGNRISIEQQTSFPWEGKIGITLKEAGATPFTLKLRIPGWAQQATVQVNGEPAETADTGTYAELRRQWNVGDTVSLDLAMAAQLIESHPLVEETRNQVAIKRGPIVYCLESPDLPEGIRLANVSIPADAHFESSYHADFLEGLGVLEADAVALPAGDWNGKLFRELKTGRATPFRAKFIPYFAWANRGKSEMSVWIPLTSRSIK